MLAPDVSVQPASRSSSRMSQYEGAAESEEAPGAAVEAANNMAAVEQVAPLPDQPVNHNDSDDESNDEEVSRPSLFLLLLLSPRIVSGCYTNTSRRARTTVSEK